MLYDKPSIKVPSENEPTIFNEYMDIAISASVIFSLFSGVPSSVGTLAIAGVSGLAGGLIGKSVMAYEQKNGRTVDEPSLFNWGLLQGGSWGVIAGMLLAPLIPALAGLGVTVTGAGIIMGGVGALAGSAIRYGWLKEDYAQAQDMLKEQQKSVALAQGGEGKGQSVNLSPTIARCTPEESRMLEERLSRSDSAKPRFVEQIADVSPQGVSNQR